MLMLALIYVFILSHSILTLYLIDPTNISESFNLLMISSLSILYAFNSFDLTLALLIQVGLMRKHSSMPKHSLSPIRVRYTFLYYTSSGFFSSYSYSRHESLSSLSISQVSLYIKDVSSLNTLSTIASLQLGISYVKLATFTYFRGSYFILTVFVISTYPWQIRQI